MSYELEQSDHADLLLQYLDAAAAILVDKAIDAGHLDQMLTAASSNLYEMAAEHAAERSKTSDNCREPK